MSFHQRRAALLFLACLIMSLSTMLTYAQDTPLRIGGSGLGEPIITAFAPASGVPVQVAINGSSAGISEFCAAGVEVALSARPMSAAEETICTINGIQFHEFLLGHNILNIVVNAADALPQCLSPVELNALFAPSAATVDWTGFTAEAPALPLTVVLPPENTVAYALLDSLVDGVGLRTAGVTVLDERSALLDAVAAAPGAVGVITAGASLPDGLRAVEIEGGVIGCAAPALANVEGRTYAAANRLFAYVNAAQVETARPLLAAIFADGALAALDNPDFTAPSADAITQNQAVLSDGVIGRQFSREVTAFTIADGLVGEITIAGSADAKPYLESLNAAFTTQYPGVTLLYTPEGVAIGVQQFCNGEIDMVTTFAPLTDDQTAACTQNDVVPEEFALGSFAPVMVVGTATEYAACLTTAETALVWSAAGDTVIETWSGVRADFPDQALLLFTPNAGSLTRDILISGAEAAAPRADGEVSDDPAYRAAAVANVPGAITFMSWSDYQNLPATEADRVRTVAVDGGSGCVEPNETTFSDGTYPLNRPASLLVRRSSIGRQDVQSYLWFANSDANYGLITTAGLDSVTFDSLTDRRSALEALFPVIAAEVSAAVLSEVTAVTVPESTPESTQEAPQTESTPESTSESGS